MNKITKLRPYLHDRGIYCCVPARWGLQQTTLGSGSDKTQGQGSFSPFTGGLLPRKKIKKRETDRTFDPFLLRQGEPGTSQYLQEGKPTKK